MDLKTTTFLGRNVELLHAVAEMAPSASRLRILEVGPGLAVRRLGRLSAPGRPLRTLFKGIETLARRLPLPDRWYENYESQEIIEAFGRDRVEMTILDINPRTLAVIKDQLAPFPVTTIVVDLSAMDPEATGLAGRFDIVVALAMLGRIQPVPRPRAAAALIACGKSGGLIVENEFDLRTFGPVARTEHPHIYRRP